jgi:hypothetical protein
MQSMSARESRPATIPVVLMSQSRQKPSSQTHHNDGDATRGGAFPAMSAGNGDRGRGRARVNEGFRERGLVATRRNVAPRLLL